MNRRPSFEYLVRTLASSALLVLGVVLGSQAAWASTAANTTIANTATVNYNDSGGTPQTPVTATATVTVTLVPSAPVLSSPGPQTIAQGTNATLTYTISATSNGPDTYNLGSIATPTNLSSVTPTLPANITLGGTTLAAAASAGNTSITVPYDGNASNASVNGLVVGSVILVGGNSYTISSITKNAGANTTTVGLTGAIAGATVAAGQIVGQTTTFTVTVPSGTIVSGSSGSQSVSTTATSATSPNPATTQTTPTVITVNRPVLTVTKQVSTDNGTTFAASGVAPPGTSLIYKITATNGGATNALSVAFSDVVPQYLTYVNGSGKYATAAGTTYAGATALTEGSGGYSYTAGTSTVSYNPGSPGIGTVAGGGVLVLFFRATVN
jgi:uncharacterized repeat protein (TIGR01451 family)